MNAMNKALASAILGSMLFLFCACGDNAQKAKNTVTNDSTAKATSQKMTARERLDKNNILEKRMTLERNGLKGNVKSVTMKIYNVPEKSGAQKSLSFTLKYVYDTKGYATNFLSYSRDGKLESKDTILYDNNGNDTAIYLYSEDGKLEKRNVVLVDKRGNQTGNISYTSDGIAHKREMYVYDDKDNLTGLIEFSRTRRPYTYASYRYDDNGMVVEGIFFDTSGNKISSIVSKRDERGNRIVSTSYRGDSIEEKRSYKYDTQDRNTETTVLKGDNSFEERRTCKYDDKGNKIEILYYNADGKIIEEKSIYYEYIYDATGNYTLQTTYKLKGGKRIVTDLTEIEIVYY